MLQFSQIAHNERVCVKINGKVIVVTGAGGGIGGALATALVDKGAEVAMVDLSAESMEQLKADHEHSQEFSVHQLDITDREAVTHLPQAVLDQHGQIDGLINCAGIIQPFVKVNNLEFDAIEKVMDVNFYGTLNMTKAFLPQLLDRPEAYLVNVSSMGGFLPVPGQSVYGASKAAVKLLTEGLYAELLDTSVSVSVVFPGATETNITENSGVDTPADDGDEQQSFPMLSADEAAKIIVEGMEKDKPHIFTGKDSKLMNKLYRLAPTSATKLITKQMGSLLERDS